MENDERPVDKGEELNSALTDILFEAESEIADFDSRNYYELAAGLITVNGKECQLTVKLLVNDGLRLEDGQIYFQDSTPVQENKD